MFDMLELVKSMIEKVFGGGASKAAADSVYFVVNATDQVWTTISDIYDRFLVPFGVCILMFMFFYALTEKFTAEGLTFEVVGKMICKLLLFCGFMEVGLQLALAIIDLTAIIVDGMRNSTFVDPSGTDVMDTVLISLFGKANPEEDWTGFFGWVYKMISCGIAIILMLIPWLVTLICEVLVKIVVLTREIEILVRSAFLPVAIGDSYNGMSSGAVRYIKSFVAVCLQGALIIVILRIADSMSLEYLTNVGADGYSGIDAAMAMIVMPTVYRIASAGLVLKSLPLAKEICGVG